MAGKKSSKKVSKKTSTRKSSRKKTSTRKSSRKKTSTRKVSDAKSHVGKRSGKKSSGRKVPIASSTSTDRGAKLNNDDAPINNEIDAEQNSMKNRSSAVKKPAKKSSGRRKKTGTSVAKKSSGRKRGRKKKTTPPLKPTKNKIVDNNLKNDKLPSNVTQSSMGNKEINNLHGINNSDNNHTNIPTKTKSRTKTKTKTRIKDKNNTPSNKDKALYNTNYGIESEYEAELKITDDAISRSYIGKNDGLSNKKRHKFKNYAEIDREIYEIVREKRDIVKDELKGLMDLDDKILDNAIKRLENKQKITIKNDIIEGVRKEILKYIEEYEIVDQSEVISKDDPLTWDTLSDCPCFLCPDLKTCSSGQNDKNPQNCQYLAEWIRCSLNNEKYENPFKGLAILSKDKEKNLH
ncbi:MAG: hypothetical protein ACTSU2_07100 [Promethearchaeota archaeon]